MKTGKLLFVVFIVVSSLVVSTTPALFNTYSARAQNEVIVDGDLESGNIPVLVPPVRPLPLSPGKWTGWSLSGDKSAVQPVSSPVNSGSRAVRINTMNVDNGSFIYQDVKVESQSLLFSISVWRNRGKEVVELIYNWDRGKGNAQPGFVLIFSDVATQFNAWGTAAPNLPPIKAKTWTLVYILLDAQSKTQELFIDNNSIAKIKYTGTLPKGQATVILGDTAGQAAHGDYVFDAVSLQMYSQPPDRVPKPVAAATPQINVQLPAGPSTGDSPVSIKLDLPSLPIASAIDIPPSVVELAGEKAVLELFALNSRLEVAKFLSIIDAVQLQYAKAQSASASAGVNIPLPDFTAILQQVNGKLNAITSASTINDAQNAIAGLLEYANSVKDDLSNSGRNIEGYFNAKKDELQAKINSEVQGFVQTETKKLEGEITAKLPEFQASALAQAGARPDTPTVQRLVQSQVDSYVARRKAEVEAQAKTRAEQLIAGEKAKLESVKAAFQDIKTAADAAARKETPEMLQIKQQVFDKRKTMVQSIVDQKVNSAVSELNKRAADLQSAQKLDPSVKSAGQISAELKQERDALLSRIDSALRSNNEEQFKAAINEFTQKWQSLADNISRVQPNAPRIRELVQNQLSAAKEQLKVNKLLIDKMLKDAAGNRDDASKAITALSPRFAELIARMNDLTLKIEQAEKTLIEATAETPTGPIIELLEKTIKADSDLLKKIVEQLKGRSVNTESVLIQAEEETSASVAKPGSSWDSTEEIRPSWRKGWTGNGDWYLSRGGDKLTYSFVTQSGGNFNFWIHDWDDNKHYAGARNITVTIDGKVAGTFAENNIRDSQFQWHMVGTVNLSAGRHTMTVNKSQTTSAAAILDAFFLTNDAKVVPK